MNGVSYHYHYGCSYGNSIVKLLWLYIIGSSYINLAFITIVLIMYCLSKVIIMNGFQICVRLYIYIYIYIYLHPYDISVILRIGCVSYSMKCVLPIMHGRNIHSLNGSTIYYLITAASYYYIGSVLLYCWTTPRRDNYFSCLILYIKYMESLGRYMERVYY